jgi:competence ComEA-like helix-hairpin-helix protein
MVSPKLSYFNIYRYLLKLLALLISCFFLLSCNKKATFAELTTPSPEFRAENAVNINTATIAELEKLPNVGAKTALRIVEHREKYGGFRKPEHLILVPGISDRRFRELQSLVKTE